MNDHTYETNNNGNGQGSMSEEIPDPFDPERLRLSQDFGANLGVKKVIVTIPVRKPSKEQWVRTHPEEAYQLQTGVVELKEEREVYLVEPALWPALSAESTFSPRLLLTTMTRQGVLFLWPIRLPDTSGKVDSWNRSALDAAQLAMKHWVRVVANMSLGGYDVNESSVELPEPEWPDLSFRDILEIAFKDYVIETLEHPVLRRLRGEL